MEIPENFEPVCGEWIFEGTGEKYALLTPRERRELLIFCEERHLLPFVCYFLSKTNSMPPEGDPLREKLLKSYHHAAAKELKRTAACQRVASILRENGVDYVPLKGLFTAFHAYPSPALRPRGDIDVLVRNSDLERLPGIFHQLNWRNADERAHTLHLNALAPPDGSMPLELHFSIFRNRAGAEQNEKLWALARRDASGNFSLPVEVHLLHTLDNAADDGWKFGLKPLFDSAMMAAKFQVDAEKMEAYRRDFQVLADPQLIFQAFPELFRRAPLPHADPAPPEVLTAFRNLSFARDAVKNNTYDTLVTAEYRNRPAAGKLKFLFSRLFSPPSVVRARYQLPPRAPFRLAGGYCADFFRKTAIFLRLRKNAPAPEVESHLSNGEIVRNYLQGKQ